MSIHRYTYVYKTTAVDLIFLFYKLPPWWDSILRILAQVSSVAGGDYTPRPRRQSNVGGIFFVSDSPFNPDTIFERIVFHILLRKKMFKRTQSANRLESPIKVVAVCGPFDQLKAFFEAKGDVTASRYVSKLNPKFGVPEILSKDLLRAFRKSAPPSNEDLCYFVQQVLTRTLSRRDPGNILAKNWQS
jgi:hypothetical protein